MVGLDCHFDFITHTNEQEAPFSTVDSDLTNQFVEALSEELFTEGAETGLARLAVLNLVVELVLQVQHVNCGGRLWGDVTHKQIATLSKLSRWQDRVEIVLITLLLVLFSLVHLTQGCLLLALGLLVCDRCRDEHRLVILHQRVVRLRHINNFK